MTTRNGFTMNELGQLNNFAIEPKMYVDESLRVGFTEFSERFNGRMAMIGFVALLATEIISGHTLIQLLTGLS